MPERASCLKRLPFHSYWPLNTWGKHIWECSQTTEGDQSVCVCVCVYVCVCVCVHERIMPFSIRGVSRERKGKNADQAALWQMVLLHDSKLESPLQLEFLLAEPRPSLRLRASRLKNPSLHPVLSPTLCFCGSSVFFKTFFFCFFLFFFCEGLSKSFKTPLAKSASVVSPHKR